MFAAKLWFPVIVLVVASAAMLVLGTTKFEETLLPPYEAMADAAARGVHGELVEASQQTLDRAAAVAANPDVRATLKNRTEPNDQAKQELLAGAEGRFGVPGYALLVRADGTVAARLGGDSAELGEQLIGLPLVAEALKGIGRDGLLFLGGKPVHAVAYPVFDGSAPLGVVLLGWTYEPAFFEKLSSELRAQVALLVPKGRVGQVPEGLAEDALRSDADGTVGELALGMPGGGPWLLPNTERFHVSRVPFYPGDRSSTLLVAVDRQPAFHAIALAQLAVLALGIVLGGLFALIIGMTLRSISRPIQALMDHLSQVQQGANVGIIPESALAGPFVRLGKQINMILQMMPSAARPGAAPLSSLGSNGGMGSSPAFGMASGPVPSSPIPPSSDAAGPTDGNGLRMDALMSDAPAPRPPSSPAMPVPGAGAGGAGGASSGLSGLFDDAGPDPLAAFRVPSQPAPPTPTPPPAPTPLPANSPPMTAEATVMFQVPQELIERSTNETIPPAGKRPPTYGGGGMPAPPQPAPQPRPMMDDNRTVVAQVPTDLLAAAAPKSDITPQDEAHYREVYDKFVDTRQECGEDISDLTYDRFVQKLLKNRQQILEKHKAKSVRFQVYVKDGKAALRALPVRE